MCGRPVAPGVRRSNVPRQQSRCELHLSAIAQLQIARTYSVPHRQRVRRQRSAPNSANNIRHAMRNHTIVVKPAELAQSRNASISIFGSRLNVRY